MSEPSSFLCGTFSSQATSAYNCALQARGKAVLVTGCDSGFGRALAKHLHQLGFTVFAGCLLKVAGTEPAARSARS